MKKRLLSILCVLALCVGLLPGTALAAGSDYLALGDSITTGYAPGNTTVTNPFANQLADALHYSSAWENQAADGETSASLLAKLTNGTIDVSNANLITITIGGNDLMNALYGYLLETYNAGKDADQQIRPEELQAALANPASSMAIALFALQNVSGFPASAQYTAALDSVENNLTVILQTIRQKNPNAKILVATQYDPYQWLSANDGDTYKTYVDALKDTFEVGTATLSGRIRDVVAAVNDDDVMVADIYAAFQLSSTTLTNASYSLPTISLDFHPNQDGHDMIAKTFEAALLVEGHENHDGWTELTEDTTSLNGGIYYLADDVTLATATNGSTPITIDDEVTLCLNGHVLNLNGQYIKVNSGATLRLCDCNSGNLSHKFTVNDEGLWIWDENAADGTVETVTGGVITGGASPGQISGPVTVSGTLLQYGGAIVGNTNSIRLASAGVAANGGTFHLYGGRIAGNVSNSIQTVCGGVYVHGGSFLMTGGTISDNTTKSTGVQADGGGVFVNGGSFRMAGGEISGNTAEASVNAAFGGGVFVNNGKSLMTGGEISGNTAETREEAYGGGVMVYGGSFRMTGGEISGNTAACKGTVFGGGVYVRNGGSFYMTGGAISDNTAQSDGSNAQGGGVCVSSDSSFYMTGGEISGNGAYSPTYGIGGGVFMFKSSANCRLAGGVISGNQAKYGGGVFVDTPSNGQTFSLSGAPVITGNASVIDGSGANFYLNPDAYLTIDGPLTDGVQFGIIMEEPGTLTSGWSAYMSGKDPADYFYSEDTAYGVLLSNGEAEVKKWDYTVSFDANGGTGDMEEQGFFADQAKALAANTFTRIGYTFAGWNTAADGSGTGYSDGQTVSNLTTVQDGTVTLYAQWTVNTSGGSSSGGSSYAISAAEAKHGQVALSPSRAAKGTVVTLTVTPDEGYTLTSLTVTDSEGNEIDLTDEGGNQYSFTMPASKVTVEAVFAEIGAIPGPLPFTDVAETAWYADAVQFVYENGLMNGVSSNAFNPNGTMTRAMLVTILHRQAGEPVVNYAMPFDDVTEGTWYSEAVRWAASEGIVTGTGATTFAPDAPITREQFAAILYRYAQSEGQGFTGAWAFRLDFDDADAVSEYAYEAMCWLTMHGVIEGDGGSLNPQDSATRAEAATMLMRFVQTIA